MYSIYADNLLIYSDVTPAEEVKVIDPKLTLADSAAGSLTMTLPTCNVGYSDSVIQRLTTDIIVKCDDEEIWRGRVIQEEYDFWKNRKLVCEGELAFLVDTIQPPHKYDGNTTISSFIGSLLTIHNQNAPANRQFLKGMVTVNDGDQLEDDDKIYRFTNYETTLQCLNEKLVDKLGGHLRVRHVGNNRYLDYIRDEDIPTNSQVIRFGENLMDFVKSFDVTEYATVVVPRGERLNDEDVLPADGAVDGLETYLTVKRLGAKYEVTEGVSQLWHANASLYVENPNAVAAYGRIIAVVDFQNVTVADNLYKKAVKYLRDEQFNKMVLEIKAVDLHYLMNSTARIKMLDKLQCVSTPHGMNHMFPISKMEISLDRPEDSIYTLGTDIPMSLTQASTKTNDSVLAKIEEIPSKSNILADAERNAYAILAGGTGGYLRFDARKERITSLDGKTVINDGTKQDVVYQITISDGPTDEKSLRKWVWNVNGLGHMIKPVEPKSTSRYTHPWNSANIAMTMDGSLVATRITSGTLKLAGNGSSATLQVYNGDNLIGSWNSAGITINKGSISIIKDSTKKFVVTSEGVLTAMGATISGNVTINGGSISIITDNTKKFVVSSAGVLTAMGATISGNVTINSGSISIVTDDTKKFVVTSGGALTATSATISGDITATTGYVGYWKIKDGIMTNTTDGSSAILSYNKIGAGKAGYGVVILRGSTRDDGDIHSGGDDDYSTDKKYGFIQISNTGDPDECRGGIRIYGNGHVVWFDDYGNAVDDRYLRNIDEG